MRDHQEILIGMVDAEAVEFDEDNRVYTIRRRPALAHEGAALARMVDAGALRRLNYEDGVRFTPVVRAAAVVL